MRVLRDGYWRDLLVHLLVIIILGSAAAWGLAWGVDTVFGDAVTRLVGDVGEYDVLIQVRSEQREVAEEDIHQVIAQHIPGAVLNDGVSIGGQIYYFLKVPEAYRSADTFEQIGTMFQSVTGFVGHSLMVEPSVVVSGIHDALVADAQRLADSLPEVAFTFRNGSSLVAVLKEPTGVARVQQELEAFLQQHGIVEIRLPLGTQLGDVQQSTASIEAILNDVWGADAVHTIHFDIQDAETQTLVQTLGELRRFLVGYATQISVPGAEAYVGRRILVAPEQADGKGYVEVQMEEATAEGGAWGFVLAGETAGRQGPWIAYAWRPDGSPGEMIGPATMRNQRGELAATLEESVRLLSNLGEFAGSARESVSQADAILAAFDEAVGHLESLDTQIKQLEQSLAGVGGEGGATPAQALITVLLSGWLNRLSGGTPASPTEEVGSSLLQLDLASIQETLEMLAQGVTELAELDVDAVIAQVEQMQRTLPLLNDDEIARSVQLIDRNLAGSMISGDRITVIAEPSVPLESAEKAISTALGISGVSLVHTAGGVISPNARMALSQILGQVRELVAALCAMAIVLLVLFFDYSLLFSVERAIGTGAERKARSGSKLVLRGAVVGAILMGIIALLSGANIPVLGWPGMLLVGAFLGLVTAVLAERINPIDTDEVVAGIALGLDQRQIMREIVVPNGRPGLLSLMNRWHQHFA